MTSLQKIILLITCTTLLSCQESTTMEEDAKKLAELNCQLVSDFSSNENNEDRINETKLFLGKMEEKYSTEVKWNSFSQTTEEYMTTNCNL